MNRTSILVVTLVLVSASFALSLETDERVSIEDVPEAVRTTILAFDEAGDVEEIEKEVEDGVTTYEIEVEIGGIELEIEISLTGGILEGDHHLEVVDGDVREAVGDLHVRVEGLPLQGELLLDLDLDLRAHLRAHLGRRQHHGEGQEHPDGPPQGPPHAGRPRTCQPRSLPPARRGSRGIGRGGDHFGSKLCRFHDTSSQLAAWRRS